eukprot:TRINITY_DN21182_c5_g1_i1.p1 TRINITY_DN21182_c5_g1~~TRINITY_DN21182_c5_g1_i1.p1  ORF type:complete len:309 (+),score=27.81 TRINITY_DN21182_c5_g1_i1:82-1008(+)
MKNTPVWITITIAALATVCNAQTCTSATSDRYVGYSGSVRFVGTSTFQELVNLGTGDTIAITCVTLTETLGNGTCNVASMLHICRDNVTASSCQSLNAMLQGARDVSFGGTSTVYNWLLAFDGRGKPADCYSGTGWALSVDIIKYVSTGDDGSSSVAVSVIAVVVVVLIVLLIALVLGVYMHQKSVNARTHEVPAHQMTVEEDPQPYVTKNPIHSTFTGGPGQSYSASPVPVAVHQPGSPVPPLTPLDRNIATQSAFSPSPVPYDATPEFHEDPLVVACADCGAQIGHYNTTPTCPVTGAMHPDKLAT